MPRPALYLSHDADFDWLACFPFGRTDDGHHPEAWRGVSERFGWMLDKPDGAPWEAIRLALGQGSADR